MLSPTRRTRADLLLLLALVLAGIAVRLWLLELRGWSSNVDDAFITYRYVRNITEGQGFVYNVGQNVLGVTCPLWALLLSLVGLVLPVEHAALGLSLALYVGLALCMDKLLLGSVSRLLRFAVVGTLSLYYPFASVGMSGMETPLFLFLLVSAALLWESRPRLSVTLMAANVLVRPEGVLILGLAVGLRLWLLRRTNGLAGAIAELRSLLLDLAPAVGVLGAWTVFAMAYFGSPIPNSVIAKSSMVTELSIGMTLSRLLELVREFSGLRLPRSLAAGRLGLVADGMLLFFTLL